MIRAIVSMFVYLVDLVIALRVAGRARRLDFSSDPRRRARQRLIVVSSLSLRDGLGPGGVGEGWRS